MGVFLAFQQSKPPKLSAWVTYRRLLHGGTPVIELGPPFSLNNTLRVFVLHFVVRDKNLACFSTHRVWHPVCTEPGHVFATNYPQTPTPVR